MANATSRRIRARWRTGWSATSLSEMTMISAERMKSVRIACRTSVSSCPGPCALTGVSGLAWCGWIASQTFSAPS
jgi:hypothetical protein